MRGLGMLLLTTTGRKTAKRRTTPLGYIRDGNCFVVIASNAGLDRHPAWYFNLQQNPLVQIQVRERILNVKAQTAQGENHQRLWSQVVAEAPGYADYQTHTTREIPLVILTPIEA
jgi:deazaflavin-dependent oxidoreductase (nitroreductase family)